jgi:hypothetical protein
MPLKEPNEELPSNGVKCLADIELEEKRGDLALI